MGREIRNSKFTACGPFVYFVKAKSHQSIHTGACILEKLLRDYEKGSIVLSSSTGGLIGLTNHEAISAAKAAVVGLMRSAAASYVSKGIRINAVAPGLTRTTLTQNNYK